MRPLRGVVSTSYGFTIYSVLAPHTLHSINYATLYLRYLDYLNSSGYFILITAADYSDLDCYADTIERDDSTSGTGHHTSGAGQQGPAGGPAQPELLEDAGRSS
ncbi:hypothetical protein Tco_1188411 [Tanacetum coccineum]